MIKEAQLEFGLDETQRWTHKRGLCSNSATRISTAMTTMQDRTARLTVLAWEAPDGRLRNLFTLLRHRRKDGMGPWGGELDEDWRIDEVSGDLWLFTLDSSLARCEPIISRVLASGTLDVKGREVRYSLESVPRRHWAYRDERTTMVGTSLRSPFGRHSAELVEYWSFAGQPRKRWREELESSFRERGSRIDLGFPLEDRSDRVGNLIIAKAEDKINCDLLKHHDQTLTLIAESVDSTARSHCGTVWADHSGDTVFRQWIPSLSGETRIAIESEVDTVGFAVFRTQDGQCVDLMSHHLVMELGVNTIVHTEPKLRLVDPKRLFVHEINPFQSVSKRTLNTDQFSPNTDRGIRRRWLAYLSHRREDSARRERDFYRFVSGQLRRAVDHFLGIIATDFDSTSPIYFADPYFMDCLSKQEEIKLWLDIFSITSGAPLRILCGKHGQFGHLPQWWSNAPEPATAHVRARIFTKRPEHRRPAFHDRYLVTPRREILISHSVNGWANDGVTFASLAFGVYRAEAERFWAMGVGSSTADAYVEELC